LQNLVEENLDLPKSVVYGMLPKMGWKLPPYMDVEDLIQAGYLGLIDAANKYDEAKGPWNHYARLRIKGAIIDWMRTTSWSTRTDRMKAEEQGEDLKTMCGGELGTLVTSIKVERSAVKKFELQDYIEWFISGLSSVDKEIFKLYYGREMTMEQIGEILDLTESAICLKLKAIHEWLDHRKNDLKIITKIDPKEILDA
jgi:RNA polymerase sigma factor (sigma-70 family)